MDYLVAARGYGLAMGFLSLAIYLLVRAVLQRRDEIDEQTAVSCVAAISACVGFTICANFAFAYASGFLLFIASILAGMLLRHRSSPPVAWARLATAVALPVFIILLLLAGSALTEFPRDQLIWGSDSLIESWREIRSASFTELNPHLVNPLLFRLLRGSEDPILRLVAGSSILYLVLVLVPRRQLRDEGARSRVLAAGSLLAVMVLALACHWIQFKLLGIPLPLERLSLWFVLLLTAFVGLILSMTPISIGQRVVRALGATSLLLLGLYFVGELRDSYFRLWRSSAEVRAAFPVVQELCHQRNVKEVASDFDLSPSFRFYKVFYAATDPELFSTFDKMPSDKAIYVLEESKYADFIRSEGLQVAWRGSVSDLVVLVRPEAQLPKRTNPGGHDTR